MMHHCSSMAASGLDPENEIALRRQSQRRLAKGARALMLALSLAAGATLAQGASQWQATNNRVFNAATAQFQRGAGSSDPVSITVVLKFNNETGLADLIRRQRTPGNPDYHHWLTNAQSTQQFGPTLAQAQAVASYLQNNGFTNVKIAPNNLLVTATGTATLAEIAFNTQISVFTDNGITGIANTSQIQVPSTLSQVNQVLGLNTMTRLHAQPMTLSTAASGTSGTSTQQYYPDQFSTVYNRPSNQTGRNTAVAIIGWGDMNGPINALQAFESARGIAQSPALVCLPDKTCATPSASTQGSDTSYAAEWTLDSQAIVGISGGVKQLLFYSANSSAWHDIASIINQANEDGIAKVVNISLYVGECGDEYNALDLVLEQGSSQGIVFSVATGDYGAYPCQPIVKLPNGASYGNTSEPSASYPSTSPYVVAVGGTTLNTNSSLGYVSESAWSGSGGGQSDFQVKPAWQSNLSGSYRQTPDVAFAGDPNTGIILYNANGSTSAGIGGTSLSAPLFAGAWAVVESANNNALDFQSLASDFYSSANQMYASGALHDVTTGNTGPNSTGSGSGYQAGSGYDNATGWGSFDITKMLAFLSSSVPTYTVTISATTGGGSVNPSGTFSVKQGATTTFTIAPNSGHYLSTYTSGCGFLSNGSGPSYTVTTNPITANCTIKVGFTQ